jgi:immune inhibitor A
MSRNTPRIWSALTFAIIVMLFASGAAARPSAVSQIVDEGSTAAAGSRLTSHTTGPKVKQDDLVSYLEPRETLLGTIARRQLGANASQAQIEQSADAYLAKWNESNYHGPNPKAYQQLLNNEQRALAANSSPAAMGLAVTGTLRLLAIAVEFDAPGAGDAVTNFSHPISIDDRTCITETLTLDGPLHNQIPPPGPRDNFTGWSPSYERDYYEKLVFSTTGITERLRLDLTDPEDGLPGIDVSGQTMRNYFNEVSDGKVAFDGGPKGVTAWLTLPHSEAYYGADACDDGEAGDIADMEGLPSNPEGFGPHQLVKDTITAINTADPTFPWADYDTNGDGFVDHLVFFHAGKDKSAGGGEQGWQALWAHRANTDINDPENVADDRGTPSPADDIKIAGYTMQYEDVETGVLVHEFSHDLGLPDVYDTSRLGESNTDAWDLMSLGSNTGKLIGTHPTNLSAWNKFALGWADIQSITPTLAKQTVTLGQTADPPAGSKQGVRIDLPPTELKYADLPPGSTKAWWTNNDQNMADVRLTRDVNLVGKTAPISISFDLDFAIEVDYDYLFVEVSTDGGATYTTTKGFEVGTNEEITTPDDYEDPNGNLERFGGPGSHGYTGDTGGWLRVYHNLSAYAGKNIKLRFRYTTDEGTLERGAFIDNIVIRAGNTVVLNDPVEGNNANGWTATGNTVVLNDPVEGNNANGWTATVGSVGVGEPLGAGWILTTGTQLAPKYYLLEWRNAVGFDKGLRYSYHTVFSELTADGRDEFQVDRLISNVPGMLVWVRDTRYGKEPFGSQNGNNILDPEHQFIDFPSEGAKGGLLIVDSHPQPLRGPRGGMITTDYGTYPYPPHNNWRGRVQSTNSAFGLQNTPPLTLRVASGTALTSTTKITSTTHAALPPVSLFNDALGYYPGVELLPQAIKTFSDSTTLRIKRYAFSDPDASVTVPARGYYSPKTPAGFTGRGGETSPPSGTISTFETIYTVNVPTTGAPVDSGDFVTVNIGQAGGLDITGQRTGNPGDSGVQYGYHFQVTAKAANGTTGTVQIWRSLPVYLSIIRR